MPTNYRIRSVGLLFRESIWVEFPDLGNKQGILNGDLQIAWVNFPDGTPLLQGEIKLQKSYAEGDRPSRVWVFIPNNKSIPPIHFAEELQTCPRTHSN